MTVSNLTLAILAMDAYNVGYAPGIDGDRPAIGGATRIEIPTPASWVAAGFYAAAYRLADGTTVISYRGTDFVAENNGIGGDMLNGYGLGVGSPLGPQAALAVEFYRAVKNLPGVTNIVVTGHSLGGGLAGYVGALFGLQGAVFDNMTFNNAAQNAQLWATNAYNGVVPTVSNDVVATTAQAQSLLGSIYGGQSPWALDYSKLSAFATTGEFLQGILPLRALQTPSVTYIDSNGGVRSVFDLHSQALLVALKWAQDNQKLDWKALGKQLIDALFNNQIAQAAGVTNLTGRAIDDHDYAAAQLTAIAYTALDPSSDPSSTPFGTTGIRSLFADADKLGKLVSGNKLTGNLAGDSVTKGLAEILVQFAGDQAVYANA